jgi:uncharacterized protein (TIGR02594 family)
MSIIDTAPWMRIAVCELGEREIVGAKHNPRVQEYLRTVRLGKNDEDAWCSAFVNWVMLHAGHTRSERANARSWLAVGEETVTPQYGDIAVLWRVSRKSWMGHVGFFLTRTNDGGVKLLGGNQGNAVSVMEYPAARVLGYRRPKRV